MQQVVCRSFPPWISSLLSYMGGVGVHKCETGGPERMVHLFSFRKSAILPGSHSRGCFGCFSKPEIIGVGEPPRGLRIRERAGKRSNITDDFWSTSAGEMENSLVASQWSVSSIGPVDQPVDQGNSTGSASNPSEFVNHGLILWNQTREQWVGSKISVNRPQVREPTISWNATYDSLLGTNKPFHRPIPLAEMVDFLVDTWDQEGLYD